MGRKRRYTSFKRCPVGLCSQTDPSFFKGAFRTEGPPANHLNPNAKEPGQQRTGRLTRAQVWLFAAGYAVLALGSAGSVWIYRHAVQDDLADAVMANTYNTKKYQDQLERYGGKANILATDIQGWFDGLWHGRHLAYTVAVLTLAAALVCFYIALFLPDFPPLDDSPVRGGDAPGR